MRRLPQSVIAAAAAVLCATPAAALAAPDGADDPARAVPGELLVGFTAQSSAAERERASRRAETTGREGVARRGGGRDVELLKLRGGSSNAAAIDRLREDPAVAYAEPNWRLQHAAVSDDPFYVQNRLFGMYGDATTPANAFGSQAGEAWAAGRTGSGSVYVGVIDEGIQVSHPDLDANVWTNPFDAADGRDNDGNGYVDDVNGWDFAAGDGSVYDGGPKGRLDTHGTHVTGTIGAEGGNATGVAGVTWNVTAIAGKFLGRNGGTTAGAIRATDYFTDLKSRHGLNVVATNNSWGGGGFSQALLEAITRGAQANILFVAAAGNSGTNNDTTPSYPANYDTTGGAGYDAVLSVAAIDARGALAGFSQFGARTVDLGAPGVDITSTLPLNRYGAYSGTSMATPHVTGAAALYAASRPGATAAEIRSAILGSAVPTASLAGRTVTGGRLDVSGF